MEVQQNDILEVFDRQVPASDQPRKELLQKLAASGLPDRKHEEYRYTPVSRLLDKEFADFTTNPVTDTTTLPVAGILAEAEQLVVFINGEYAPHLSRLPQEQQIKVELLSNDGSQPTTWDKPAFNDRYLDLNRALTKSGVQITIAAGSAPASPLYILHLTDTTRGKVMATPAHFVKAEESSQFTLVEVFSSEGINQGFVNSAIHLQVARHARLNHIKVGLDTLITTRLDHTLAQVAGSASYNTINIGLGGQLIRNNLYIGLQGEHAEAHLYGLYLPEANGLIDHHTAVDHRVPYCNSNELYKGILAADTTGVFNGKVFVRPGAQKTNAFQSNKNILLDDSATINTKPQLEIWADDVKCSHGCTTGQIDKEQLFYLRARGLDEASARKLLLRAFAEEVIEKVAIAELREYLEEILDSKLPD